jgi:hypothetical protein
MNSIRLSNQLALESASSAFTATGELSEGAIATARQIMAPSTFSNPAVAQDVAKFATQTFQSPSGPFKVHFYMKPLQV